LFCRVFAKVYIKEVVLQGIFNWEIYRGILLGDCWDLSELEEGMGNGVLHNNLLMF
jgi:hypothetical protein